MENNEQQHTISKKARHSSCIHQRYVVNGNFEAFGEVKTDLRTLISLPTNIWDMGKKGYISQKGNGMFTSTIFGRLPCS